LSTLTVEHTLLKTSILRFIVFDGMGLLLLAIARLFVEDKKS
jgi:hypothetical protein